MVVRLPPVADGWFVANHDFPGLWASGKTVEEAREPLRGALEGRIILTLRQGEQRPTVNGINLTSEPPARHAS